MPPSLASAFHDLCDARAVHPEAVLSARERLQSPGVYARLAETFGALADPNRTRIVSSLMGGELCVCDLAAVVGISESAVSQHLRILRNLRWVRNRKQGRVVYYSLEDDHVKSLMQLSLAHASGR